MSTITEFSELALDPDQVRSDLQALGIDDSVYTDAELESLGFVSNIVLLATISDKSTEIEELLTDYEIEVSKLSAMQEVLTTMRQQIDESQATGQDLMDFVEAEETFIDAADTALMEIEHTVAVNGTFGTGAVGGTVAGSATYDTLEEYISALESNAQATPNYTILELAFLQAADEDKVVDIFYSADGTPLKGGIENVDDFFAGTAYLRIPNIAYPSYHSFMTYDDFKDYLIAVALQDAGYIGDDVYIEPVVFANTSQPSFAGSLAEGWISMHQLYFGKVVVDSDSDRGIISVDYNGTAALKEMSIDLAEYSRNNTVVSTSWVEPFASEEDSWFMILTYVRGFDAEIPKPGTTDTAGWNKLARQELTDGWLQKYFDSDDIDLLLEATATAIESQSTSTEVSLLSVNTGITEWGELNDVWDLVHEYIHDALKRAGDNSV